jgi:hypothetical protein
VPSFWDTESCTRGGAITQVPIPVWNDLFIKFKDQEYLESTPHNNLELREVDDSMFLYIRRSRLHSIASRAPFMPCVELIEWVISHTDAQNCRIINDKGECIGYFLPRDVNKYYKLLEPEESLNKDFVISFYEKYDTSKILGNWWKEDKNLLNRSIGRYVITGLREPYMYAMVLLCRLYGEKDCSQFLKLGFLWHTMWLCGVKCLIGDPSSQNNLVSKLVKPRHHNQALLLHFTWCHSFLMFCVLTTLSQVCHLAASF